MDFLEIVYYVGLQNSSCFITFCISHVWIRDAQLIFSVHVGCFMCDLQMLQRSDLSNRKVCFFSTWPWIFMYASDRKNSNPFCLEVTFTHIN